jgi:DNA-binding LacI/PurR family transcriptional regulator
MLGVHLIKLGCRSLCFLHPPHSAPSVAGRIAGIRAAMEDYSLPWSPNLLLEGNAGDPAFIERLLRSERDAFVAVNDHTAALLLQGLLKRQIDVPRQIRVVGFDDSRSRTAVSYSDLAGFPRLGAGLEGRASASRAFTSARAGSAARLVNSSGSVSRS